MPSLVTLPFIQCHHTRGRALIGGSAKPAARGSLCAQAGEARVESSKADRMAGTRSERRAIETLSHRFDFGSVVAQR